MVCTCIIYYYGKIICMYMYLRRTAIVTQCDSVWSLMRSFSSGQEPVSSLPPKLQRMLMLSLLSCDAGERQQQFTREVRGSLAS